MFDWNDQDQDEDPIWGELRENEDHIVPYPKGLEENKFFNFGKYGKKQRKDETSTVARTTEQTTGSKNDFLESNLENSSSLNANEFSSTRLDMDTWPDLPSLSSALTRGYNEVNGQDCLRAELVKDFAEASNMNKVGVQLDGDSELFGDLHEDKESDSFLDCDWADIGGFDDLDGIFRNNESIFAHEMVGSAGEFLSQSTDVISSTVQSIPIPDLPINGDQFSDQGFSSVQFGDSDGKSNFEEKMADSIVKPEAQIVCEASLTSEHSAIYNKSSDRVGGQKKPTRSRKKTEDRSKNRAPQSLKNGAWSHLVNQSQQFPSPTMHGTLTAPVQTFQSPAVNQLTHPGNNDQFMVSGYGYPLYPFPAIPQLSQVHAKGNHQKAAGHKLYSDPVKHSNTSDKQQDVVLKPSNMTPQEKIEKLRRRQQMQAMLAIQQQQQQFGRQITGTECLVSQASQKNQSQDAGISAFGVEESASKLSSSELSILGEQDEANGMNMLVDNHSLAETIYYQLQDALTKLDVKVRICFRDSLFRLAKSAMERQSASDRSSTNKSNRDEDEALVDKESKNLHRSAGILDVETDTNPIDRTVAHLLFHRPTEPSTIPVNDGLHNTPVTCNPASRPLVNASGNVSKEQPGNFEEMDVQPQL